MADNDDLMIEVAGSSDKAASAIDKIIAKVTQMQEAIEKVTPSLSKFTEKLDSITAGSKAFAVIEKLTKGTGDLAAASKKAEANEAMYQARIDRATVSMERSRVASEKLAAAQKKAAEYTAIDAHNESVLSMSPEEYAKNGYDHTAKDTLGNYQPRSVPTSSYAGQYDSSKIQAEMDALTARIGSKGPKVNIDAEAATAEVRKIGEYIDGLTPKVSAMSSATQAQFNAIAAKLTTVSQRIDNQRMLYRSLADQAARVAQEQGSGSTAYLQLEKRMLTADSAAQRLSDTQEKLKAELADVTSATGKVGTGMTDAGNKSERAAKKSTSAWSNTMRMFEKMMIRIAAFKVFSAFSQGITTGMQNMALASSQANSTMSALATSSLYLKNSVGAALMPVLQALVPVINQVTNALAGVFNAIAMLNARIFNHASTVQISKRSYVDYAKTISQSGNNASQVAQKQADAAAKAAAKATKAQEEAAKKQSAAEQRVQKEIEKHQKKLDALKKSIMGFDELNTLTAKSDTWEAPTVPDYTSNVPTAASYNTAAAPAWNGLQSPATMFETVKIPQWVNNLGTVTDQIGRVISTWWNGLTDAQKWGAGIGGTAGFIIGGIIGHLIGGPIGTVVGAALGAAAGVAIGAWWAGLTTPEKWGVGIGATAGTVIGGIIGHLIGGKVGTAVGAALGGVIGGIAGKWWADLTTPEKWSAGIGAGAGGIIGGIIGGILTAGNPIGIAVGVALSGTVGAIVGKWWNSFTALDKWTTGAGGGAGAIIGGIIGTIVAPGLGTAAGALVGGAAGAAISAALIKVNSAIDFKPLSDKVSQGTKEALSKFDALYKGADEDLKQLEWSGDKVTKDMAEKIGKNVDAMTIQTIAGFTKQENESIASIKELAQKSGTISAQEASNMAKSVDRKYSTIIAKESAAQQQIEMILKHASDQHRGLTQTESETINKLKAQMYSNGIKSLSENQVEEQAIYDNMRINHTATSAQEAADIVKSSKSATDKVIADANNTYNQKVATIIRERDEMHSISSDEADKLIKAAEQERDGSVKAAEDKHKKVVDEAKKQSGDLINDVDWQNGQVKSKWDTFWDWYKSTLKKNWSDVGKGWNDFWSWYHSTSEKNLDDEKKGWDSFWSWYGKTAQKNWSEFGKGLQNWLSDRKRDVFGFVNGIIDAINGAIGGINWVLSTVGSKTQITKLQHLSYAYGTSGHPGGPALVNDATGSLYREAVQLPSGKTFIPQGRNVLIPDLPRGSKVLPAEETHMLFPHYAGGIGAFFGNAISDLKNFGTNIWQYISDPRKLFQLAVDKFSNVLHINEPWLSLGNSAVQFVTNHAADALKGIFTMFEAPSGSGSGVDRWRGVASQALAMTGHFSPHNLQLLLAQMNTESGGNPSAINGWDINARLGHPSQGLMQVIPSTFSAYALPGHNSNILDPLSNIIAAIRYTWSVYGGPDDVWGQGHGYKNGIGKFDFGGWCADGGLFTAPTLAGMGDAGPEAALPLNDRVFSQIAQGIQKNSSSSDSDKLDTDRIIGRMDKMEKAIENMKLYLYSDDRKIAESANNGNRIIGRTRPMAT